MDSRNMQNDNHHLGVNKLGKNIRKSPLHQPNFSNATTTTTTTTTARQQPQPQVYNINKNDFRNIVQQLTGSPSRDPLPPHNPPKPSSMRLQRIRPPPLASLNRPQMPNHQHPPAVQNRPMPGGPMPPYGNGLARPPLPTQFSQPSPTFFPPNGAQFGQPSPSFFPTNGGQFGQPSPSFLPPNGAQFPQPSPGYMHPNTAESPISAYMRYLQTSVIDSGPKQNPGQAQPPVSGQPPPPSGLNPNTQGPPLASPRTGGLPPLLPSPTSQFLLPSPSGFMNLLSPRSPYPPLLSPGYQFPPPDFAFTPMGQPGILGPGPQPPVSPGLVFPPSPGFFPMSSPRWKDQWS